MQIMIKHLKVCEAYTFAANCPNPEKVKGLGRGQEILGIHMGKQPVIFYEGRLGKQIVPIVISGVEACIAAHMLQINEVPAFQSKMKTLLLSCILLTR
jgi:hypothetical protein